MTAAAQECSALPASQGSVSEDLPLRPTISTPLGRVRDPQSCGNSRFTGEGSPRQSICSTLRKTKSRCCQGLFVKCHLPRNPAFAPRRTHSSDPAAHVTAGLSRPWDPQACLSRFRNCQEKHRALGKAALGLELPSMESSRSTEQTLISQKDLPVSQS